MNLAGRPNTAKVKTQANGSRYGNHLKVVCAFDEETFAQIRGLAIKQQVSVAEQIRQLVEFGLMDVETGKS